MVGIPPGVEAFPLVLVGSLLVVEGIRLEADGILLVGEGTPLDVVGIPQERKYFF